MCKVDLTREDGDESKKKKKKKKRKEKEKEGEEGSKVSNGECLDWLVQWRGKFRRGRQKG